MNNGVMVSQQPIRLVLALTAILGLSACDGNPVRDQRLERQLWEIQSFVRADTIFDGGDEVKCHTDDFGRKSCSFLHQGILVQAWPGNAKIFADIGTEAVLVAGFEPSGFFSLPRPPFKDFVWYYEGEWSDTIAFKVDKLHAKLRAKGAMTPHEKKQKHEAGVVQALQEKHSKYPDSP